MKLKKIASSVLAAMMALSMTSISAFAVSGMTCGICGNSIPTEKTADPMTYMEAYEVPEIEGLESNSTQVYSLSNIKVVSFQGNPICKDCLEDKIEEYKASQNTTTTKDVPINAKVESNYLLLVPQTVVLTNSTGGTGTYSSDFNVSVKGDIGESQTVTVATTAPTMQRTGAKDVVATVTAPKTKWNRDEVLAATASTYTVKADLTPGTWAGTMIFNCSIS